MTIGDLLSRNAHKFPGKLSLVSEEISMNYRTLNERVNRLANSLIDAGLKKGDRIGALVHNSHQFFEIYFAAAKTGGIFCPYNNHLKGAELRDVIDYSTPKFLFVDRDYVDMIAALKSGLATVERYICLQAAGQPFMEQYETMLSGGNVDEPASPVREDDALSIFFTAGTTGRPKGAVRTHRHLLSDAIAGVIELKVDYDEKVLITFPLYHVAGEDNIVRHMFMANSFYIKREGGFDPVEILRYIAQEKITRCQMVPTMIHSLLQISDIGQFDLGKPAPHPVCCCADAGGAAEAGSGRFPLRFCAALRTDGKRTSHDGIETGGPYFRWIGRKTEKACLLRKSGGELRDQNRGRARSGCAGRGSR